MATLKPFRLIIAGSRGIDSYDLLKLAIIKSGLWKAHGRSLEIVSGMARGVDALGLEFAEKNGLVVHKMPADWDTYGKSAGHRRNAEMAAMADGLLALWDGQSPGTKGMIEQAKARSLVVHAYECRLLWTLEELK